MIDTIYSAHLLKNVLKEIPKEIDIVFKSCTEFFGNINVYKICIKEKCTIFITNIEKQNLSIYDMIEFLRISKEIYDIEDSNMNLINSWRSKTIYLRKKYDDDYDYMNFFDIFPSVNAFSLDFYFNFEHNKFMFSDQKSGPHYKKEEIDNIIKMINIKESPFAKTPSIEYDYII